LDPLLLIVSRIKTDANPNPRVILHPTFPALPVVIGTTFILGFISVHPPLYDQPSSSSWDEFLKNLSEILGNLSEGSLNGLVFTLI
jgi:hypothetical protein